MHLAKPDVEIFQTVLKEAGLKADEVLFIDDSEENCQAAAKLGIGVCHYVPGDNLFTIHRNQGLDPEQGITGITYYRYPAMRTISGGINVSF